MKVILVINIYSTKNTKGLTYEKMYNSEVVPKIGEKIKDSLFAEYKIVTDVIHDYLNEECYVILKSKEVPHERLSGHIQEVADMHNWVKKRDD